jgi:hypothetical protein
MYKHVCAEYKRNKFHNDEHQYTTANYPVFKNLPHLNDTINNMILGVLDDNRFDAKDVETALKELQKAYDTDTTTDDVSDITAMSDNIDIKINTNSSQLIILIYEHDHDGGAHPVVESFFINWDRINDKTVALDDIFVKSYWPKLNRIAEKIFKKDYGPLEDYRFGNTFALNDNFIIKPEGLEFLYNEYEIASYMQGIQSILIPYSKIKSLLRPNTVVSQYIK